MNLPRPRLRCLLAALGLGGPALLGSGAVNAWAQQGPAAAKARAARPRVNPLEVLGLQGESAFKIDPAYGFSTGIDSAGFRFEAQRIVTLEFVREGAVELGADPAALFIALPGATLSLAFLERTFPSVAAEAPGRAVLADLVAAQPVAGLLKERDRGRKGRQLFVRTRTGTLYLLIESPADGPDFTRLLAVPMPKRVVPSPSKPFDERSLPPCSEGRYPCRFDGQKPAR